jgi:hypothetical protein
LTKIIAIFLFLLHFASCGDKEKVTISKSLKQELTDSLAIYSSLTEVVKRDDSSKYVLFLREVNKHKIGVVALTDSVLFLFNKSNEKWVQMDSIKFDTYATSFEVLDLNSDNNDDFIIHGFGDMHGQSKPFVFISDVNGFLHYRSDFHHLYNIRIDKEKNLIESFYTGGEYSNYKETYIWDKDSLILAEGVKQELISNKKWTTFYKIKNGQRLDIKKLEDSDEKIYTDALFKY